MENFLELKQELENQKLKIDVLHRNSVIQDKRITDLENDCENIYYSFLASRVEKKTLEELAYTAVCQYFNISIRDLFDFDFKTAGRPSKKDKEKGTDKIISARKWVISITRYMLSRSPHGVKMSYPFYTTKREIEHREVYLGALSPITKEDKKNRDTLLSISAIVKQLAEENGVSSDVFNYI